MLRVPLEWLRSMVPVRLSPEALADRLTLAGFEVTGVEPVEGDVVFSLEITPNRADCLSILGLAREVAALTKTPLKLPWAAARAARKPASAKRPSAGAPVLRIEIHDRAACRRYIGRLLEDVAVGPAPEWMQRRLVACGVRPINNIVDITNYVLLETGQPLHAFDYDRLAEGRIVVRRARSGEKIHTLDGLTHALAPEMLVIADANEAVAVAGVMGGAGSQITPSTRRVLLESAEFDAIVVRRTGRRLGLASESSYRFERGIDPEGVALASRRAGDLIREHARAREVAAQDVGQRTTRPVIVAVDPQRSARRLGIPVTAASAAGLKRLGFGVQAARATWKVTVPSFRRDVRQAVDIDEELVRLHGYDRLPEGQALAPLGSVTHDPAHRFAQHLRQTMAALGATELMTWALISEEDVARIEWPEAAGGLRVANPLSRDHVVLRPTLVGGLLHAATRNLTLGASGIKGFEVGTVFDAALPDRQTTRLGMVIAGQWERSWQGRRDADLYRLKGMVEQLIQRVCGVSPEVQAASASWAEAGQCMAVTWQGQALGVVAEVAPRVAKRFDAPTRLWVAELDVPALRRAAQPSKTIALPSPFPPVKRDLSVLVARDIPFERVRGSIERRGAPLAKRVELVDRYAGPQVPTDKHSLTFSIEYRDPAKTLTADEVDRVHRSVTEALAEDLGAQLR
jgi:phenylalanyl-tRNA synthetase beta chain